MGIDYRIDWLMAMKAHPYIYGMKKWFMFVWKITRC